MISRFAPSTTGEAHPGTLLSALLVWLDARSRGGQAVLRLEDIDLTRVKPAWRDQIVDALAWLGLAWDDTVIQSERTPRHEEALDRLAEQGRLYPCACSRAQRSGGRRAPDGGWAYENTCRGELLPAAGWRAAHDVAIRVRLPDERVELVDDGGLDLSQTPAIQLGDPIVRRRDGAIAYQLAVVVDDADAGITDVIRGRDIAPSTATQVLLQRLLGFPQPRYRHHFLLLEPATKSGERPTRSNAEGGAQVYDKLAKLHGSIPWSALRERYSAGELLDILVRAANLVDATPQTFDWSRVPVADKIARWDGAELTIGL
ncbi:MAG: glutamate--tRNA ligase family protein [Deltaproteobacteria bacterium]